MASERVEERVRRAAKALEAAGIAYAVIGGNAVRVRVASREPGAVRATKDVDLLVNRADADRITSALEQIGFRRETVRSNTMFGLVDDTLRQSLPADLRERLREIEGDLEE